MKTLRVLLLLTSIATALLTSIACGGGAESTGADGGGRGGRGGRGGGPMAVEMVTLQPKPVEQASEFIGTIKSRQSTTIQPQVEGFITRIAVKSGDRVNAGALLMDIDSRSQQASIASLESVRAQREIDVTYAKQETDRAKLLLDAGAGSQMEADRAANTLKAAEAQVRTVNEQIRQLRTDLGYYRVTAPAAGIVGDIPVREGDRVTKSTLLTTVDANAGLEVYLNIPLQQAPQLRPGLPVRLLDENGQPIADEKIDFISPSVDTTTQTVLAKVPLSPGAKSGAAGGPRFRTAQFVRTVVVWSTTPTLTVPVTSVVRINGQFFVFVAEAQAGSFAARQRAVTLGAVVGNDYVVLNGLKAGEMLIVSGVQKIGDGAPVSAARAATTGQASPASPARPGSPAPPASTGRQ